MRLYFSGVCGSVSQGPFQSVERLSFFDVVPMVSLRVASVFGGYFMQCFVFSFNEVFLLEIGFKLFLFVLLLMGGLFVVVRSLVKFFVIKFSGFLGRVLVSFVCTM